MSIPRIPRTDAGKLDRHDEFARPDKDIYLKPLQPGWKTVLNQ